MARVNYKALVAEYNKVAEEHDTDTANRLLRESFESRAVRPGDMEFGALFSECFGFDRFAECRARKTMARQVMEAAGAVQTSAFTEISGQIVFSELLDKFNAEDFVFSKMIPTVSTRLSGERIAGVTAIGDEALEVAEGEAFPLVGVGQDWIDSPPTRKRGLIVPVTKEAIFFDRTSQVLEMAGDVGAFLGMNKEKRAIDAFLDLGRLAIPAPQGGHRYHWRNTSYATYQASTPWINVKSSNPLTDWTSVDAAELQFNELLDPNINEPISVQPTEIVVHQRFSHTAGRILTATENRTQVGGFATSGNLQTVVAPNTLKPYTLMTSKLYSKRMVDLGLANTTWHLCNIRAMLRYMENWPITTEQAPSGLSEEFHRDIVIQYKASERGAFTTKQPRATQRNTA